MTPEDKLLKLLRAIIPVVLAVVELYRTYKDVTEGESPISGYRNND